MAEKLHAYTRTYEGERTNTRVKDLVDLTLIAELSRLDAVRLHAAIASTFARRDAHPAPSRLPSAPLEWARQFRRLAEVVGVPLDVAVGHRESAALLDPILSGEATYGSWDPERRRWTDREAP
ncbi:MAG TPA: nucleotidyl transferase AbiEii/AbiGii toxin family protein [Solirubrobacteraceae bacterium]|nr:nucleotidyl transferase AbiEii/AbiGii toxin family protein [Solirubrobacteraceae bacterium]